MVDADHSLLVVLSAVLISLPYLGQSVPFLIPVLLIWGIGQSTALTTLSTLLTEVSHEHRGTVMELYSFATNMAVALASSMMVPVYTKYGYGLVTSICGVVTLMGVVILEISAIRKPKHTSERYE
ncbi:MFS transporter [Alicyclobacillus shizuokensis]|uniref:MFS transporter n=1 Tax=Alicyclobacillus shizuokensis TaxID=392014 RepID=UPI0014701181|nr:MFS transporter [Alicyclobacillus shizuokensis]